MKWLAITAKSRKYTELSNLWDLLRVNSCKVLAQRLTLVAKRFGHGKMDKKKIWVAVILYIQIWKLDLVLSDSENNSTEFALRIALALAFLFLWVLLYWTTSSTGTGTEKQMVLWPSLSKLLPEPLRLLLLPGQLDFSHPLVLYGEISSSVILSDWTCTKDIRPILRSCLGSPHKEALHCLLCWGLPT